jgi:two-component system sensor kinase FixL
VHNDKLDSRAGKMTEKTRERTEELVHIAHPSLSSMSDQDIRHLVYELQIHQVELELQNQELRETQVELASSRDRFADLYDFAPVGYLSLDSAGFIVEANLTAATLLGVERGSIPGLKFSSFVTPACQDTAYLYWQRVFDSTQRQVCELDLHRADDTPLFVRLQSTRVTGPHGPDLQCRVALMDIGDTNRAERELQDLNRTLEQRVAAQVGEIQLMAKAIANLGEGVLITSDHRDWLESRIVFANDALCQMLGLTREDLLDQSPGMVLADNIDLAAKQQLQEELTINRIYRGEFTYSCLDGRKCDLELLISPIFDVDTQRTNYVAVLHDITTRKQAKKILRDREERLRAILDTTPNGIITIDCEGIVKDCNSATTRIFGYSAAELVGRNVSLLMPEPYCHEHDSYLRHFRDTGEARIIGSSRQLSGRHRDGRIFPLSLMVNEIDHLGLYLGVVQDVSELRALQQEVLRAADQVQWHIGQGLHDGPQQTLAGLSLLSRCLTLDLKQIASPLESQADRLSRGLLEANESLRRLARGLVPLRVGDIGLNAALQRLARQISEDHGIQCEFVCVDPIRITDDYTVDQLYHIAQEATLNAVNHARARRICISLERRGREISLRVSDDGIGFDSGQEKSKSRGLGMYIMPYRAATIAGVLTISQPADGGTAVSCTLIYPPQ